MVLRHHGSGSCSHHRALPGTQRLLDVAPHGVAFPPTHEVVRVVRTGNVMGDTLLFSEGCLPSRVLEVSRWLRRGSISFVLFAVEISALGYSFPSSAGLSPTFKARTQVPDLPGAASLWKAPRADDPSIYHEMSYVTFCCSLPCAYELAGQVQSPRW